MTLNILQALQEKGHDVVVATIEPTDWDYVSAMMGRKIMFREMNLIPFKMRAFGIYMRLLTSILVKRLGHCDFTINTHGDMIIAKTNVIYIHFPTFKLMEQLRDVRVKYKKNLFWRLYFEPYNLIQKWLWKWSLKGIVIITNSLWGKEQIQKFVGKDAMVTYPPVVMFKSSMKKENIVLTVSRFTWEKRLDLIPPIAKKLPNVKFVIVGSTSKTSKTVIDSIQKQNAPNVRLYPDASLNKLSELYGKAKIYLHMMHGEHFGITIPEAMSAGCVPIVHKTGGPWNDIVSHGKYGFGYDKDREIVEIIKRIISDDNLAEKYSKLASERSRIFSEESFRSKFVEVMSNIYPDLVEVDEV